MVNFASKHEFKKANKKFIKPLQPKHADIIQDDDTLMSADDMREAACEEILKDRPNNFFTSHPINIQGSLENGFATSTIETDKDSGEFPDHHLNKHQFKQNIESEMSGETSNNFPSSPNTLTGEVREIRAGCRRVREDSYRPGYSIGFNEDLLK